VYDNLRTGSASVESHIDAVRSRAPPKTVGLRVMLLPSMGPDDLVDFEARESCCESSHRV